MAVCRICNCSQLQSISIGRLSFSSFTHFEMHNLPSLQSLILDDYCFTKCSQLVLTGFPSLQTIQFGESVFADCNSVFMKDLVSLRSIALGRASLRFREYGDNTLVMRNLPSLTTFIGDGYNWERVDSLLLEHLPSLSPTSISFNTKFPHKPICTCIDAPAFQDILSTNAD
ncbi:hypothetical protein WA588_002055 [Blastocystis sp. NMH]